MAFKWTLQAGQAAGSGRCRGGESRQRLRGGTGEVSSASGKRTEWLIRGGVGVGRIRLLFCSQAQ